MSLSSNFLSAVFNLYPVRKLLVRSIRRQLNRFDEATHRCRQVQEELLQRIVRQQASTTFGRDHGFGTI